MARSSRRPADHVDSPQICLRHHAGDDTKRREISIFPDVLSLLAPTPFRVHGPLLGVVELRAPRSRSAPTHPLYPSPRGSLTMLSHRTCGPACVTPIRPVLDARAIAEPWPARRPSGSITSRGDTMKITTKGQVTIPVEIREKLGLLPNTDVDFEVVGQMVRMRKVRRAKGSGRRGKSIVQRLRGRGSVRMTTDQILALTRGDR